MDNPKIATLVSVQIRESKDEHRWLSNFRQKLLKRDPPVSEGAKRSSCSDKGVVNQQRSWEATTDWVQKIHVSASILTALISPRVKFNYL
jgi:hypothetical protein